MPRHFAPRRTAGAALTLVLASCTLGAALPAAAAGDSFFTRIATVPAYLNAADPAVDSAVAEISSASPDGRLVYSTDSAGQRINVLDISDPDAPKPLGGVGVGGEPTSVYATGEYVLAVVDTSDGDFANPSGHVSVLHASDLAPVATIELGGQPDSIDVTTAGDLAVIAIENQRDEEFTPGGAEEGDLPQLPAGELVVMDLTADPADWVAEHIPLTDLDGLDTPSDPEPEYVSINPADTAVAVTLQENNAVAIVDLATREVTASYTAGTASVSGIDTLDDDRIALTDSITDVPREPDAIGWVGDDHVAIANEGDWKGGTRGWSILDAASGEVVWDAGNTFDHLAVSLGLYPDKRSDAKGSEPEGLLSATFDGVPYVFVGAERANFVAVYDVSDPTAPRFVQALPSTPGPEGLLALPERDLLVVSSETDDAEAAVRASVQLYALGASSPAFPTIASADVDGSPLPWGALSGLSGDPVAAERLYAVSDSAYAPSTVYSVDTSVVPALIDSTLTVTEAGEPAALDLEGIAARADGGFWAVTEGATGPENALLRLDPSAAVLERIALPAELGDALGSQGFEGVTIEEGADGEIVWTALQREASIDADGIVRLGRYDVAAGSWSFYGYPLEAASGAEGDWNGLSEITLTPAGTLAVIERDKRNGPDASLKAVYTVPLPTGPGAAIGEELPVLEKTLAADVLPALEAGNGWTQEKLEGLGITGAGEAFAVTDNDAVDDANGETVLASLGSAAALFGAAPTPEPTAVPTAGPTAVPTAEPTAVPTTGPTTEPTAAPTAQPTAAPTHPAGAVPPRTGSGSGSLASTGVESGWLSAAALSLLAGGALVLGLARRRRTAR
ncbi:esterase-like activity of phytase family protein [Rathayibacter sp. VKM Ac-2760]|uniref:esterase-like activity of phytase family protein n=1 Tax=Rathayibacter sp. VKM Ac-2760 TaxID=2609253 RepID=UPI001319AC6C|nr:esterase-like activity of phytase family protein [Rathayibacter sp. VKM Ac-2760]QHC57498.1 alkaline phosphatase [Rathayibacter sp. VKM Ac-2760]